MTALPPAIACALLAALLFGASTPLAKMVLGSVPPLMLAGLLYLFSGLGLFVFLVLRQCLRAAMKPAPSAATMPRGVARADLPWLAGVVLAGGVAGPVLLMLGLARIDAASASLLLNLENVFTALLAWFAFREAFDRRILVGMLCIVAAGLLLAWSPGTQLALQPGAVLVVAACLCWALDNNLTRRISGNDAVQIAAIKGLVAGVVNVGVALGGGVHWPAPPLLAASAVIGLTGYGISLALAVVAFRGLGTARTGAYFSAAPFIGAALSLLLFDESPSIRFWLAGVLMASGLWLHLTEEHSHLHQHDAMDHTHPHVHDEHHQHEHDFQWDGKEPHTHAHHHAPMVHEHSHYPDLHHRHTHGP